MSNNSKDDVVKTTDAGFANRIAELQYTRLLEEQEDRATKKAADALIEKQALAIRNAHMESTKLSAQAKLLNQQSCPHMKPNFRPATGGQKDHKGTLHMICQYCQKEWTGHELPSHLYIPSEMIGGPQ